MLIFCNTAILTTTLLYTVFLTTSSLSSGRRKVRFSVRENSSPGSVIGQLNRSSAATGAGIDEPIKFEPIMRGNVEQYIQVDSSTGLLKLKRSIDRETVCSNERNCVLHFRVKVTQQGSSGSSHLLTVAVVILDENDNAPRFEKEKYVLRISEASKAGTLLKLPLANDADSILNGVKKYVLKSLPDDKSRVLEHFQLTTENVRTGGDQDSSVVVVVPMLRQVRMLDRETVDRYTMHLLAEDAGGRHRGTTVIQLTVEDANDNYPQWRGLPYQVSFRECDGLNAPLLQLAADDADLGRYGYDGLSYKISELADSVVRAHFHLYGEKLFVSNALDYENRAQRRLSLPVLAIDEGGLRNSTTVELTLLDCNDNAPSVTLVFPRPGHDRVFVQENDESEVSLVPLDVMDADSGENGRVSCDLGDSSGDPRFRLDILSGGGRDGAEKGIIYQLVKTKGHRLDREKETSISVEVRCRDHGRPPRNSAVTVVVAVLDVNDNAPELTRRRQQFSMRENNERGRLLGRLEARDADSGENGAVVFSLVNQTIHDVFQVARDGRVYANSVLDRESNTDYSITVRLTDRGTPPLSSEHRIRILVEDENDNSPEYVGDRNFRVEEGRGSSAISQRVLGRLNCSDADSGRNGVVKFVLEDSATLPQRCRGLYSVTSGGVLSVRGVLDRETAPVHQLLLVLVDGGRPVPRSSSVQLTVHLTDLNDNAPRLIRPVSSINVSVDISVGAMVTVLKAEDDDAGKNGEVQFEAKPPSIFFTVRPTGEVLLKRELGRPGQHTLNVRLFDLGNRSLQNYAPLKVFVHDYSLPPLEPHRRRRPQLPPTSNTNPNLYPPPQRRHESAEEGNDSDGNEDGLVQRRRQMNLVVLIIMAVLVVAVFFAVIAVLTFLYYKKERFSWFGATGGNGVSGARVYRNSEKPSSGYGVKINQHGDLMRPELCHNVVNNAMGSPKRSLSPSQITMETDAQNLLPPSSYYNTIIMPQAMIGASSSNLQHSVMLSGVFDNRCHDTGPDLHHHQNQQQHKLGLLNYYESECPATKTSSLNAAQTEKDGYFSLHQTASSTSYSRLCPNSTVTGNNNRDQQQLQYNDHLLSDSNPPVQDTVPPNAKTSNNIVATGSPQHRMMKIDSSFV